MPSTCHVRQAFGEEIVRVGRTPDVDVDARDVLGIIAVPGQITRSNLHFGAEHDFLRAVLGAVGSVLGLHEYPVRHRRGALPAPRVRRSGLSAAGGLLAPLEVAGDELAGVTDVSVHPHARRLRIVALDALEDLVMFLDVLAEEGGAVV